MHTQPLKTRKSRVIWLHYLWLGEGVATDDAIYSYGSVSHWDSQTQLREQLAKPSTSLV